MEGEGKMSAENKQKGRFKRICVFCGSRVGYKSAFSDAALVLGDLLVEKRIDLVYGGGRLGLMGLISETVLKGGCHVLGEKLSVRVASDRKSADPNMLYIRIPLIHDLYCLSFFRVRVIPKALFPVEISGETFGEVISVANMHERKSIMAKHADAFIALPGGYGTMEELLEVIAWSQLGIHDKPVGLLNVNGYFNSLLTLFDKGVEEGFIDNSARHIVVIADTAAELIKKMEEYVPIHHKVAPRQSWAVDHLILEKSTETEEILKA